MFHVLVFFPSVNCLYLCLWHFFIQRILYFHGVKSMKHFSFDFFITFRRKGKTFPSWVLPFSYILIKMFLNVKFIIYFYELGKVLKIKIALVNVFLCFLLVLIHIIYKIEIILYRDLFTFFQLILYHVHI